MRWLALQHAACVQGGQAACCMLRHVSSRPCANAEIQGQVDRQHVSWLDVLKWQQHQVSCKRPSCNCCCCCCWMSCSALVAGRLLVGLGIGASAIVVPAYLAEIAPAKNRGMVVQMYEVGDDGDALIFVHVWGSCCCCCSCFLQAGPLQLSPLCGLPLSTTLPSPLLLIACPPAAASCSLPLSSPVPLPLPPAHFLSLPR